MEALIRYNPCSLFRVIGFPDNGRLVTQLFKMPVETALCDIETAAGKPFYLRFFKVPVQYFVPFFPPLKGGCDLTPKSLGVFYTFLVSFFVGLK
jgi:hypothetical protein